MTINLSLDESEQVFLLGALRRIRDRDGKRGKALAIADRIKLLAGEATKITIEAPYGPHLPGGAPFMFRATSWPAGNQQPVVVWGKRKYENKTTRGVLRLEGLAGDVVRFGWQRAGSHRGAYMHWGVLLGDGSIVLISNKQAREAYDKGSGFHAAGKVIQPAELFAQMPTEDNPNTEEPWPPAKDSPEASAPATSDSENAATRSPTGHSGPPTTADGSVPTATSTTSSSDSSKPSSGSPN